jgi:hypothetical protein
MKGTFKSITIRRANLHFHFHLHQFRFVKLVVSMVGYITIYFLISPYLMIFFVLSEKE